MRKIIALFMALVLLCGLSACRKNNETQPSGSKTLTSTEALVHQAHQLAKQLGTVAGSNYMKALNSDDEVISIGKMFTPAATELPGKTLVTRNIAPTFVSAINTLIAKTGSASFLKLADTLSFRTQFSVSEPLSVAISVFLQYGDLCNILVHLQPKEGNLVSATVIPLPVEARDIVLNQYFKSGKPYAAEQFADQAEAFASLSFDATCTGKTLGSKYYAELAKQVFANTKALSIHNFDQLTTNEQVINQAIVFSKALSGDALSAQVYDISDYISSMTDQVLSQESGDAQLREWMNTHMALTLPDAICTLKDDNVLAANAVLADILTVNAPGAIADQGEKAVLVILELTGNMSVAVVFYPGEYNTYYYSFSCLTMPFDKANDIANSIGAVPMQ